ncbi:MAG TPA: pyridoxal 5'-phosphate synthase glutaminase subunit PdxT [Acidimicrobiales bacterium]|jgi:5'-phosphate synthase pdxT subunit|nr:pyridoxal 5'-phosphate synthase glutaminase subunit PdxT [Acidimicrobiales bacterium]MDP7352245.1 pyridoxal 5'-phosphate synthase glutaminase subunit PdxT [Acidimicrobiales bacterium]HJM32910.1 pyridoxal 5'-phosphate synthase glutaminase subunit PdxT [Acidimicrobiales bacterium]|tara:strand:- start:1734 stop:2318 length:585 start_codon:yes stop_codon:yes gene_type:complete
MKVGVLALQGAFASHAAMLGEAGATPIEVRRAHELAEVDALVMPGGESTTMSMLLDIAELREPLAGRLADGMPVFGTCAGMILLAVEVLDGRSDQRSMGAIDLDVRRNGYGRQVDSFETELAVEGFDDAFHGVFIRSPVVERIGPDVEVLAEVEGRPVLCRQGNVLVASFHPELAGDVRIHRRFLEAAFASDAT